MPCWLCRQGHQKSRSLQLPSSDWLSGHLASFREIFIIDCVCSSNWEMKQLGGYCTHEVDCRWPGGLTMTARARCHSQGSLSAEIPETLEGHHLGSLFYWLCVMIFIWYAVYSLYWIKILQICIIHLKVHGCCALFVCSVSNAIHKSISLMRRQHYGGRKPGRTTEKPSTMPPQAAARPCHCSGRGTQTACAGLELTATSLVRDSRVITMV